MTTEQEIAKDFVCSFINSGIIKNRYDAISAYKEMLSMLENQSATDCPEASKPAPYNPFENM